MSVLLQMHLKIIEKGLETGKKILFVPDRCLGAKFCHSDGTEVLCYRY